LSPKPDPHPNGIGIAAYFEPNTAVIPLPCHSLLSNIASTYR